MIKYDNANSITKKYKKKWAPSPRAEAAPPARAQNLRTTPMEPFSLLRLPASRIAGCIIETEKPPFEDSPAPHQDMVGGHSTQDSDDILDDPNTASFLRAAYALQAGISPTHPFPTHH